MGRLGAHGGHDIIHGSSLTGDVSPFRHMRGREGDSSSAILAVFGRRVFNKVDARLARAHWQLAIDRCWHGCGGGSSFTNLSVFRCNR